MISFYINISSKSRSLLYEACVSNELHSLHHPYPCVRTVPQLSHSDSGTVKDWDRFV